MQATCNNQAVDGNETTIEELAQSESNCILPDGTLTNSDLLGGGVFVKQNTWVKLDSKATCTGRCLLRWWNPYPTCGVLSEQLRTIAKIAVTTQPPDGQTPEPGYIYALKPNGTTDFRQLVDSRLSDTTGSVRKFIGYLGEYLFKYQSTINTTSCNIQPGTSMEKQIKVNSLTCRPIWWIVDGVGGTKIVPHLPAEAISIYVPETMTALASAVDSAAQDWQSGLAGTGVTIARVSAPCGTGGNCIDVVEDPATPLGSCANLSGGAADGSTGVMTRKSTIGLLPGWSSWPETARRHAIGHELGHALGLGDSFNCSTTESIMKGGLACDASSGYTASPTRNDILPTKSSTYGNKVQKTCGL